MAKSKFLDGTKKSMTGNPGKILKNIRGMVRKYSREAPPLSGMEIRWKAAGGGRPAMVVFVDGSEPVAIRAYSARDDAAAPKAFIHGCIMGWNDGVASPKVLHDDFGYHVVDEKRIMFNSPNEDNAQAFCDGMYATI